MAVETPKSIEELVKELGRYPLEAFQFLHAGLDYTVKKIHGPLREGLHEIHEWLEAVESTPDDLPRLVQQGAVPGEVQRHIRRLGGVEATAALFNRHVSGPDLCRGLRELALRKWGLMASTVLRRWGIRNTMDFGRMIFALVNSGLLQKQAHDRIEDFDGVYDFDAAFDGSFQIDCTAAGP